MLFPLFYTYIAIGAGVVLTIAGVAIKRKAAKIALIALGVIAGLGGVVVLAKSKKAIVFRGKAPAITYERSAIWGVPKVNSLEADMPDPSMAAQWIINESDATLLLNKVYYSERGIGLGLGGDKPPMQIPPDSAHAYDDDVTDIGPDHPPPQSMTSTVSYAGRTWITW